MNQNCRKGQKKRKKEKQREREMGSTKETEIKKKESEGGERHGAQPRQHAENMFQEAERKHVFL